MGNPSPHRPRKKNRRHVLLVQSWWEDHVLRGVASYAAEHDWALDCRMRWTHQLPPASTWQFDGIIAYTGIVTPRRELVNFVKSSGVPVVETQDPGRIAGSARVLIPHDRLGELAAEHLIAMDFQHLGFVTFEVNPIETQRQAGFARKIKEAGKTFHEFEFSRLAKQLHRAPKPLGLMAANDVNALSVILACADAGFAVPEEIAVVGVDDTDMLCDLAPVPLTSVNCNFERQGYEAAALLDSLMNGAPVPAEPIIIEPLGVTVRRSTDTVAIPDLDSARFLRFLRDHFRELLSLEESAKEMGVSMRNVQTNFRRHLGHTVIQELTRLRVEHAKKLLLDPNRKVETVGTESGFANRFHFIKAFLRVTGQTPRSYREQLIHAQ